MNNLSWMLYLADVVGNFQGLLIGFSIVLALGGVVWAVANTLFSEEADAQLIASKLRYVPYLFVGTTILATLLPSSNTIYMIAGSEATEAVVTSEEGKEILNDIKEVIKHQLDELKPQEENEK